MKSYQLLADDTLQDGNTFYPPGHPAVAQAQAEVVAGTAVIRPYTTPPPPVPTPEDNYRAALRTDVETRAATGDVAGAFTKLLQLL